MAQHGRGWLPLIGVTALVGSAVDARAADRPRSIRSTRSWPAPATARWFAIAAALIGLGIVCELVDVVRRHGLRRRYDGLAAPSAGPARRPRRPRRYARLRDRRPGQPRLRQRHRRRPGRTGRRDRVRRDRSADRQPRPARASSTPGWLPPSSAASCSSSRVLLVFARRTAEISLAYQETQGRIAALLTEAAHRHPHHHRRRHDGSRRAPHPRPAARTAQARRCSPGRSWLAPAPRPRSSAPSSWSPFWPSADSNSWTAASPRANSSPPASTPYSAPGLGSLTGVIGEIARATRRDPAGRRGARDRARRSRHLAAAGRSRPADVRRRHRGRRRTRPAGRTSISISRVARPSRWSARAAPASPSSRRSPRGCGIRRPGRCSLDGVPLQAVNRHALRSAVGCAFERPHAGRHDRRRRDLPRRGQPDPDARRGPRHARPRLRQPPARRLLHSVAQGTRCPAANGSASAWPAPGRRVAYWSWTTRLRASTPRPRCRSARP